jgi:hypothetical protein
MYVHVSLESHFKNKFAPILTFQILSLLTELSTTYSAIPSVLIHQHVNLPTGEGLPFLKYLVDYILLLPAMKRQ